MPSVSPAQHNLMEAAAHTPGGYDGVPQAVGKDFAAADKLQPSGHQNAHGLKMPHHGRGRIGSHVLRRGGDV